MANDKDFKVKNGLVVGAGDITSTTDTDITVTPSGTGQLVLDGLNWPTADGSANQVLKTDGSGQLSFVDQSGGGAGSIQSEEHFSVTAATTTLTISGGPYAATQLEVYLNGVKLRNDATSGWTVSSTTLTIASGLIPGDEVTIVKLESASSFTVSSTFANLSDTTVTSQTSGSADNTLIKYNGSAYVPTSLAEDNSGNVTSLVAGDSGNVSVDIRKANVRTTTGTVNLVGGASLYNAGAAATYSCADLDKGDIVTVYAAAASVAVVPGASTSLFKDGDAITGTSETSVAIGQHTIATVTMISDTVAIITGSGI